MQKNLLYSAAFVVLVLLQIFLIDNIALGVYFHPLIYIAFVVLLPLDMKDVWVLLLATLMGLTIDFATGMCGVNVMASAAVGFLRPALLGLAVGHTSGADDTIPVLHRMTAKSRLGYIALMVLLHSAIYFLLEALSLRNLHHTLLRLVASDVVAVPMVWYIVKIFTERILAPRGNTI